MQSPGKVHPTLLHGIEDGFFAQPLPNGIFQIHAVFSTALAMPFSFEASEAFDGLIIADVAAFF
jgi:hypothetical protein